MNRVTGGPPPPTSTTLDERAAVLADGAARRAETIAGLRALAEFLEENPEVPVSRFSTSGLTYHCRGEDDQARRDDAERIAGLLDVEAVASGETHLYAIRQFGGGVTYRACAITARHMAEYTALMSYGYSVQPDGAA